MLIGGRGFRGNDVEVDVDLLTIALWRNNVTRSEMSRFKKSCFWTNEKVLKRTGYFLYSTMASYMSNNQGNFYFSIHDLLTNVFAVFFSQRRLKLVHRV